MDGSGDSMTTIFLKKSSDEGNIPFLKPYFAAAAPPFYALQTIGINTHLGFFAAKCAIPAILRVIGLEFFLLKHQITSPVKYLERIYLKNIVRHNYDKAVVAQLAFRGKRIGHINSIAAIYLNGRCCRGGTAVLVGSGQEICT